MKQGKLLNMSGAWFILEENAENQDVQVKPIHEIHSDHSLWLLVHGNNGDVLNFILDENGTAILKAKPDATPNYAQD